MHISRSFSCFPVYFSLKKILRFLNDFFFIPGHRSTPCPQVKTGDEWGDPVSCDAGDQCQYCHTRTEQQFHPEIYKSTKCNDIQNTSYCPRGAFCAFAHVERESFFLNYCCFYFVIFGGNYGKQLLLLKTLFFTL